MTQEDKELLLRDLCCRLPYGVMCKAFIPNLKTDTPPEEVILRLTSGMLNYIWIDCRSLRSYLRPMSSMTEKEKLELYHHYCKEIADDLNFQNINWEIRCCVSNSFGTDWLNKRHFDYRGLIEKGLALEAPVGVYNI